MINETELFYYESLLSNVYRRYKGLIVISLANDHMYWNVCDDV